MKEQLIREVQRQMLPYLNNAQLKQLQGVLEGVLSGVELSRSAGMVDSAKVDTVACFINAKRIEGCSEKTLSYYRQTIVSMLSGIDKEPLENPSSRVNLAFGKPVFSSENDDISPASNATDGNPSTLWEQKQLLFFRQFLHV